MGKYDSSSQFFYKRTVQDVELGGVLVREGMQVLLALGAANRDPAKFLHADRFDITRDPNPHLAFGHGIHFCIGAPLARLEAKIALTDLLERLTNLQLASDEPWEPRKGTHVHGPTRLPLRFTPGGSS